MGMCRLVDDAATTTCAADCTRETNSFAADVDVMRLLTSRSRLLPQYDHQDGVMPFHSNLPHRQHAEHPLSQCGTTSYGTGAGGGLTSLSHTLPSGASQFIHQAYHHTTGAAATMLPLAFQNQYQSNDYFDQQQLLSQYNHGNTFRRNNDLDLLSQYFENQSRNNTKNLMSQYGSGHAYYPSAELASLVAASNDRYRISIRDILNYTSSSSAAAATSNANMSLLETRQPTHDFNSHMHPYRSDKCITTAPPSSLQYSNVSSSTSSTSSNIPPSGISNVASNNCVSLQELTSSAALCHPTSLEVKSDSTFLDPVHIFLRRNCIELFSTTRDSMMNQARGARASKVGQVGLRCIWCKNEHGAKLTTQAICFPSKRETIFDSVRNYQRKHIEACPCIPEQVKAMYKSLLLSNVPFNKSQRLLKAYYAEAASELGIVDSPKGLIFGAPPNTSDTPSENLQAIVRAAESPDTSAEFWKNYKVLSAKDKSVSLRKFEHLVSNGSREVIMKAKRDTSSALVFSQDFPKVGDVEFLLYKQVIPFKPSLHFLQRRHIDVQLFGDLTGLCCKFCAHCNKGGTNFSGLYLPTSISALSDFSFTQSLLNHMMTCRHVPRELKDTFDELKHLASTHCVVAKRGSIKKFLEKIWERLQRCPCSDSR